MSSNRLLVIDDEPDIAATLGRIARRAGFDTIVTTEGQDFIDKAQSWRPTVVVLDLAMAELGGREILSRLAGQRSDARILIIGGGEVAVLEAAVIFGRGLGLRMVGILHKPLRLDVLRETLGSIYDAAEVVSPRDVGLAIDRGEFVLEYQPKVWLETLEPCGVEALARWRHPTRGLVPPDSFIPIMEASGVMERFTPHVVGLAAAQMGAWRRDGLDLGVAINVSGDCVSRLALDEIIAQACADHRLDPGLFTLEITETAAMGDVRDAATAMRRLKDLGVKISIDDFGTGYSSLTQLRRLPFSEVKIDKSFVLTCDADRESRIIIASMVNLAHNLDLDVVAEGIETAAVRDHLRSIGCDAGQGYLFSRPLPPDRVAAWVRAAAHTDPSPSLGEV